MSRDSHGRIAGNRSPPERRNPLKSEPSLLKKGINVRRDNEIFLSKDGLQQQFFVQLDSVTVVKAVQKNMPGKVRPALLFRPERIECGRVHIPKIVLLDEIGKILPEAFTTIFKSRRR